MQRTSLKVFTGCIEEVHEIGNCRMIKRVFLCYNVTLYDDKLQ